MTKRFMKLISFLCVFVMILVSGSSGVSASTLTNNSQKASNSTEENDNSTENTENTGNTESTESTESTENIENTNSTGSTGNTGASDEIKDTKNRASTEAVTNEEVKDKTAQEDAYAYVLDSDPSAAGEPDKTMPGIPDTTYQKYFSFESPRVLKGIISSGSLYFSIPDYWDTKFVYAAIEYDTSRLINEDVPASLTFLVNNVPVSSCNVSYQEGSTQLAYVTIPTKLLTTGFNVLKVVSYVRIFDYEGCSEDQSWANWININEKSYIYAGYELKDPEEKISYYPYPFISTASPTGEGTSILTSDQATNGEIAAAMYLMADLSTETGEENKISVNHYSDSTPVNAKKKIVISLTENLPEELKHYLQKDLNSSNVNSELYDLSSSAMVRFVEDETENPILLIIADKEENLMEAVQMLLDPSRLSQEKVSTTIVNENSAQLAYESKMLSQLVAGSYTVKDIMGSGITFIGPFHQEETLYLPFGNDYLLSSAGKISLKFRYSENLDFNRSLVTVYWGDIPVASKKLTKENASEDELTFAMPADVVGTTASSIRIAFELEIKDLFCTMRQDEMPWAYVTEDSVLYLPSRENNLVSFDYFPSPYQNNGIFNNVLIITGDNPDSAELELLGKTIALYGYEVAAYGKLKVIHASEFREEDADYNIITTGTSNTNSFLKSINDQLYFKYNNGGDAFISNENLILSGNYASDISAFQLMKSPFAKERVIFAICGTNAQTLDQAENFLSMNTKRWDLKGDCVLLDHDLEWKSFEFTERLDIENKPSITEFIAENKQPLIFTIMAISAMFILLLAAILILIRSKNYKKNE
ncbi:MAG: putative cell wall anchored protein, partial [Herbinix sp.]|nr:putative cell wall anchored protein [Herbinix sp.]